MPCLDCAVDAAGADPVPPIRGWHLLRDRLRCVVVDSIMIDGLIYPVDVRRLDTVGNLRLHAAGTVSRPGS